MVFKRLSLIAFACVTALLGACSSMAPSKVLFTQVSLPAAAKVPAGNRVAPKVVGESTYECRNKADAPGFTEWVLVGPNAALDGLSDGEVGKYIGPPATLDALNGCDITATRLVEAPSGAGKPAIAAGQGKPCHGSRCIVERQPRQPRCQEGRRRACYGLPRQ